MSIRNTFISTVAATFVGLTASAAFAQTEVQWWHAMGGVNGERVNKIAEDFNINR